MLKITDASNFRRTLAGLCLICAPLAFGGSDVIRLSIEGGAEEGAGQLTAIAANPGLWQVAAVLNMVGIVLFVPAVLGLMHLMRERSTVLGHLGAQLAGLNVQAGVLRRLIQRDPAAADEFAGELRTELRAAISDIRRLVYGLRPPALDDLGLVAALRRLAAGHGTDGTSILESGRRSSVEPASSNRPGRQGPGCWSDSPCQRSERLETLRILVAEDHPLFRKGVISLLSSMPDFEVVGEAVALATDLQPDVVLMDLQMPEVNGIEATRRIVQESPTVRVLVVTLFEDDESVFTALRAGARGYVLKDADEEEVVRAIKAVGRNEAIFSPAVAERVLAYFAAPRSPVPPQLFPTLTDREREVLNLTAQGQPNPAIAKRLHLSTKTVGNYVSNVFTKLQVADRAQAIIRAREAGMG